MTDTTITTDQSLSSLMIMAGDRYILDPAHNITITINVNYANTAAGDNSIVVMGEFIAHPDSTHDHKIIFSSIDESKFVGAPNGKGVGSNDGPPSTDPGIWIMDAGKLDFIGKTVAAWNRTGTDATWGVSDDIHTVPWAQGDVGDSVGSYPSVALGYTPLTYTTVDGNAQSQEVFNITRNLHIWGTSTGNTHVMNMSSVPSNTQYVDFRYTGLPSIIDPVTKIESRAGRYTYHNHLRRDGSRGSMFTGLSARNTKGNVFVSHGSNGLTWTDCVAYSFTGTAFWYDLNDDPNQTTPNNYNAPDDLTYDHCAAFGVNVGKGFLHDATVNDNHNEIKNCVVVGTNQTGETGSGYDWSNHLNGVPNIDWNWHDNVIHNYSGKGLFSWQNGPEQHTVRGAKTWRCAGTVANNTGTGRSNGAVDSGAYKNDYDFIDGVFDDIVADETISHADATNLLVNGVKAMPGKNWIRCAFTIYDHETSPLQSISPTRLIDCSIRDEIHLHDDIGGGKADQSQRVDLIRCGIDIANPSTLKLYDRFQTQLAIFKNPLTVYRVQNIDGTAYQMHQTAVYPYAWGAIAPFALYITTASLSVGTSGSAYSQTLTAALGTGQFGTSIQSWALASGTLPTGMAFSAGVLSGTPTQNGTFPLTFRVEDSKNFTADRTLSLVVGASAALQITTSSLPSGSIGTSYSQTLAASGGTGPYTWSLNAGSGPLPTGLSLSSAGVISGVPTTGATYSFTVKVTDLLLAISTRTLSILVQNVNPVIATTAIPSGEVGVSYSYAMSATAGDAPYTWSVASGSLPTGLALSSGGVISGTPTTVQSNIACIIQVTDNSGRIDQDGFTITIAAAVSLLTTTVNPAIVGVHYAFTFTAHNGVSPYNFLVNLESLLPVGMTLDSDGLLSGTATSSGTYPFQVLVVDAVGVEAVLNVSFAVYTAFLRAGRGARTRGGSRYVSVR